MNFTKFSLFSLLSTASVLLAQTTEQIQNRIDSTNRESTSSIFQKTNQSSKSLPKDVSSSDTGAQRPISLSKSAFSPNIGYNVKYFYRSNPLASNGKLKQAASGLWTHTFSAGLGLGIYDFGDSVVTPYVGGSWTSTEYVQSDLENFNFYSSGAYFMLLAQYGNGWSARAGINYASDRSAKLSTEDYSAISPSVGIMKAYSLSSATTAIFDASLAKHDTSSLFLPPFQTEGLLSSWESSVSYGLRHKIGKLTISPKYSLRYKLYDESTNDGRKDLTNILSVTADYPVVDDIKATLFANYVNRDSSGVAQNYDYKSWDGGLGLSLSTRF